MIKKVLIFFLAAFLLFGASIGFSLWRGVREIQALSVGEVSLAGVTDGDYLGEYAAGAIKVRVQVSVHNGMIASIAILEHDNGRGAAAERITDSIVAAQSLQVDAIGGASLSSKVILKAVEDALSGQSQ
ncbi:MAG: FMN-binding protein [Bacillota bacterium]|nr:FMN-binding protein [Bacillota bacterium]MDW7683687.1 FMN-binding protein [Bacillota bacterium]